MSLDSVTETIAHFVGTFNLTIEQARLRDQYEEFTAMRRKVELEELQDPTVIKVKADLDPDPGKYNPLPYRLKTQPDEPDLPPFFSGPVEETTIIIGPPPLNQQYFPDTELGVAVAPNFILLAPQYVAEVIGSAVTYTFQNIHLRDNDTVGSGDFRDADQLMAQAEAAAELAESLHAVSATVAFDRGLSVYRLCGSTCRRDVDAADQ